VRPSDLCSFRCLIFDSLPEIQQHRGGVAVPNPENVRSPHKETSSIPTICSRKENSDLPEIPSLFNVCRTKILCRDEFPEKPESRPTPAVAELFCVKAQNRAGPLARGHPLAELAPEIPGRTPPICSITSGKIKSRLSGRLLFYRSKSFLDQDREKPVFPGPHTHLASRPAAFELLSRCFFPSAALLCKFFPQFLLVSSKPFGIGGRGHH